MAHSCPGLLLPLMLCLLCMMATRILLFQLGQGRGVLCHLMYWISFCLDTWLSSSMVL